MVGDKGEGKWSLRQGLREIRHGVFKEASTSQSEGRSSGAPSLAMSHGQPSGSTTSLPSSAVTQAPVLVSTTTSSNSKFPQSESARQLGSGLRTASERPSSAPNPTHSPGRKESRDDDLVLYTTAAAVGLQPRVSESPTFVDTNTGSALYAAAESTKPAKGLSEGTKAEFCAPIAASLSAPEKDLRSSIQDAVLEINRSLGDQKWIYTRGGRTIDAGERMRRIVKGIDECAKIVDVLIQHYPDIVALVWGGVRFVLMVAVNKVQFMENLEATMSTIIDKIAACEFYALIYQERHQASPTNSDIGLDEDLKQLYAAVQIFLDKAKDYFNPEKKSVVKRLLGHIEPFSVTIQPLIQDIQEREKILEKYALMATMERIKENASQLQKVQEVIKQIEAQMEPLVRLDNILNATQEVKETLVEFQHRVVEALQPQQQDVLFSKSLDSELQELKNRYLGESDQTDIFRLNLYIAAEGMTHQNAPEEERFGILGRLQDFLKPSSTPKICLIQGAAGSGKSTFIHYLARALWEEYDQRQAATNEEMVAKAIPLFLSLASLHDSTRHNQDLIGEFFRRRDWTEEKIRKARQQLRFVFILDGYDEIEKRDRNFYLDNRLGDWRAKTVITSRPEYLGLGYQIKFYPPGQPQVFQEYWLAPFSIKDILEYISKYIEATTAQDRPEAPNRTVQDYVQFVERPELRALISNPFLLKLVMTVQPSTTEFKRVSLYQRFLGHWLNAAYERLSTVQLPSGLADSFRTMCEGNFVEEAEIFCLEFGVELYRQKSLQATYIPNPRRSTSTLKINENVVWKYFLTNDEPAKRLLRYSLPLVRVGQSYRFLHKSLRDYTVAQSMWQELHRYDPDSIYSDTDTPLNEFNIVDDPGIVDFIVEEAEQNENLQDQLLACVEASKKNPGVKVAAANAITILVRAGRRFSGHDLQGVRIPGADISAGWFENAQLQTADLSRVHLQGVWLRGANLTDACMGGSRFGEGPYFRLEDGACDVPILCSYMLDGELLVISRANFADSKLEGTIQVWSVTYSRLLHTFEGHTSVVWCASFAPNEDHVATGSGDTTVRLWSRKNQGLVHTFDSHTDRVCTVEFSPNGELLASGSNDKSVCLWSITKLNLLYRFYAESQNPIVVFSPNGQFLVSTSDDYIHIRLTESGKPEQTQKLRSKHRVLSVAFAPDSQLLASAGWSLELWSVGQDRPIDDFELPRKNDYTYAVGFSTSGQIMATASSDKRLRIWAVGSGRLVLVHLFEGISQVEHRFAFAWDGTQLAVGARAAEDNTVRQWLIPEAATVHVNSKESGLNVKHSTNQVTHVALSRDGRLLASAGYGALSLWSLDPSHICAPKLVHAPKPGLASLALAFCHDSTLLVATTQQQHLPVLQSWSPHPIVEKQSLQEQQPITIPLPGEDTGHYHSLHGAWTCSPDRGLLASSSISGEIFLWSLELEAWEISLEDTYLGDVRRLRGIDGLAFSPDGQLLSAFNRETVRLWSVRNREMIHVHDYQGHVGEVRHVAFSPDGNVIASASDDKTARLLSVPDCKFLHTLQGHTRGVTCVTFSPDGLLLASGSEDTTVRLWALHAGEPILSFDTQNPVSSLAWGENGLIAVGTSMGGVQLWHVLKKADYSARVPTVEVSCLWASDQGTFLSVSGANIQGVTGLDPTNLELLKQRGAIGEPAVSDRVTKVEEER